MKRYKVCATVMHETTVFVLYARSVYEAKRVVVNYIKDVLGFLPSSLSVKVVNAHEERTI